MMINSEEKKIKGEEYHERKREAGVWGIYVITQNATVLLTEI